jgi:hypothetical protein
MTIRNIWKAANHRASENLMVARVRQVESHCHLAATYS